MLDLDLSSDYDVNKMCLVWENAQEAITLRGKCWDKFVQDNGDYDMYDGDELLEWVASN